MPPAVSVVMPLFNKARYVEQALASALQQTLAVHEIIVVDDGSTDGSQQVVAAFALAAPNARIQLLTQPNSGGAAVPRNRGIELASGEFVAFLDPDDYWLPEHVARCLEAFGKAPAIQMAFNDAWLVDEDDQGSARYLGRMDYVEKAREVLSPLAPGVFVSKEGFLAFSSVYIAGPQTSGVVARRDKLLEMGQAFATDLRVGEDLDLWFRLMASGPVAYVDEPLHAYRIHDAGLMALADSISNGTAACHARNFHRVRHLLSAQEREAYGRRIAESYAVVAYNLRKRGETMASRRNALEAWQWGSKRRAASEWIKSWF